MNTAMLKNAGLPMPPDNWTASDFLHYAQKLTTTNNGQTTFGFQVPGNYVGLTDFLINNGTNVLNADFTKCTLDSPKSVQVIQFLNDMIHKYKVSPVPSLGQGADIPAFVSGKNAMYIAGRWPYTNYKDQNFTTVAVHVLPTFDGSTPQNDYGTGGYSVMSNSKHQELAFKLAAFLTEYQTQIDILPAAAIPSRQSVLNKFASEDSTWNIFLNSTKTAHQLQAPVKYTELSPIVERDINLIFAGQIGVSEGLKNATDQVNAVLQQ